MIYFRLEKKAPKRIVQPLFMNMSTQERAREVVGIEVTTLKRKVGKTGFFCERIVIYSSLVIIITKLFPNIFTRGS